MTEVEKLKLKLKEAEEQEISNKMQEKLDEYKKQWVGKAFSTHLFSRNKGINPYISSSLIYYKNVGYDKDSHVPFYFIVDRIVIFKAKEGKNEYRVSENQKDYIYDYYFSSNMFRYDIPVDVFNTVKKNLIAKLDTIYEDVRQWFRYTDYITIGDSNNEQKTVSVIKESGLEYIDIKDNDALLQYFTFIGFPLLSGTFVLKHGCLDLIRVYESHMDKESLKWGSPTKDNNNRIKKLLAEFKLKYFKDDK
jgi:hypothetical protein